MTTVQTASGPIEIAALGRVLMHEHVAVRTPGIRENWPARWDEQRAVDEAVARLDSLAQRGIGAVVDATTPDMGRDPALLAAVAARTSVRIIVATGVYWIVPVYWWRREANDLAAAMIADIRDGIAGTGMRAGIIKLATAPEGITPRNEMCLRAGARAHRATGAPITTHASPPALGREQQAIFRDEGVDLERVIIGHQGDTTDTGYLKTVMDAGSTIGMDRFGMHSELLGLDDRIRTVAALCRDGYAGRMVLSHDTACAQDWFPDPARESPVMPNGDPTLLSDTVIPALKELGVAEGEVQQMLTGNPRGLFERQGAY